MCFLKPHEQGFSAKIRYKNLFQAKPETLQKLTFYRSLAFLGYSPVLATKKKKKRKRKIEYITKCDVKVRTHLNFCRNNGKPAAVTSWGLGDVGGKLRLGGGGAT